MDGKKTGLEFPDMEQASNQMAAFAERSSRIVQAFIDRQNNEDDYQVSDPFMIGQAFMDMAAKMMADPVKLAQAQTQLMQGYMDLWTQTAKRMQGETAEPVVAPAKDDKRFKDATWTEDAVFDTLKQSYLLTSNWMQSTVRDVDGLDLKSAEKVNFYTRQFVDALSPTNFAATNPKVLKETMESKGENLTHGLENFLRDMEKGEGELKVSMTDTEAFTPGENIATSPGKVVFQTELMQLLQYDPTTETVFKKPLLIVPPWINKFYILDLKPKNSFIKWATDQGHTVFVISWLNPDASMVDFADPGELGVFVDEMQLEKLDAHLDKVGYLDSAQMSQVFNMMRDNDLIWSFVVNNYLMGREPMAFDLLYWNADSTRMPAMMHKSYLRNMYLENKLVEPGGMEMNGVPLDLSKIKTPVYLASTKDDHIAPWKSTYSATQIYAGPVKFVLSASGHIAGIINPPAANKYCYWTNDKKPEKPDEWFDGSQVHDGSWWGDWQDWVTSHAGPQVKKRIPGDGKLKPIEDAPGSYVLVRSLNK